MPVSRYITYRKTQGFSLLEPLIALLIFTIGLIAIGKLLSNTLAAQTDASQQAHATWFMQDFGAAIVVNRSTEISNNDPLNHAIIPNCATPPTSNCSSDGSCTPAQFAFREQWLLQCGQSNAKNGIFVSNVDYLNQPQIRVTTSNAANLSSQNANRSFNVFLTNRLNLADSSNQSNATKQAGLFVIMPVKTD